MTIAEETKAENDGQDDQKPAATSAQTQADPPVSDSEANAKLPHGFQALPHNIEAEQGLLGAIMVNNAALDEPSEFLKPEHFYEPVHASIFEIMLRLNADGLVINAITLASSFEGDERLAKVDGTRYLAGLARAAETILNATDYARLVFDLAQSRSIVAICQDGMNSAMNTTHAVASDWKGVAERITSSIGDIAITEPHDRSWTGMDVVEALKAKLLDASPKVTTGYKCLDDSLGGGMGYGRIYGFDASPKSNKTTVLSGIQRGANLADTKTHFFSLEQAPTDLALRECCGDINASYSWMEDPKNAKYSVPKITAWQAENLYYQFSRFDHVPGIAIDDLLIRMNRSIIEYGIKVFFLDYYTKIGGRPKGQNEASYFDEVAKKLSAFVQATNTILVIALQQNRTGQNLWSDGIKRECSWLATIHKVEAGNRDGGTTAEIWFEVTDNRYGREDNVGSDEERFLRIVRGPALREIP